MRFFVPPRLESGVYRPEVGLVKPGGVLELGPDEVPSPLLIPLDAEAQAALKKFHGIAVPLLTAPPEMPAEQEMTFREYTENRLGMKPSAKKSDRAADR